MCGQAVEDQAINRVHRLGQTRRVLIKRLLAPDTVEDTMLELQVRVTGCLSSASWNALEPCAGHLACDVHLTHGLWRRVASAVHVQLCCHARGHGGALGVSSPGVDCLALGRRDVRVASILTIRQRSKP